MLQVLAVLAEYARSPKDIDKLKRMTSTMGSALFDVYSLWYPIMLLSYRHRPDF